jgi:hypothetical protein
MPHTCPWCGRTHRSETAYCPRCEQLLVAFEVELCRVHIARETRRDDVEAEDFEVAA